MNIKRSKRDILVGNLLVISVLASLISEISGFTTFPPGLLQLSAGLILWPALPASVQRQSIVLVFVGLLCLYFSPHPVSLLLAISKNGKLISLLAAIGLLRRVPLPENIQVPLRGYKALWQTLFGLHWFGSVLNISALAIFSDSVTRQTGRLKPFQGVMLTRSSSLAALWSPFFIAMGVVLTYATNANYWTLIAWNLPLTHLLLSIIILYSIKSKPIEIENFIGYPFQASSLAGPLILAAVALLGHQIAPNFSIISIITLAAPCYSILSNLRRKPITIFFDYISNDLPRMGSEIILFVSAGILGAGLSSVTLGHTMNFIWDQNPLILVWLGLAIILLMSSFGVHPIIGITLVGGILATKVEHNLLAMSFLMSWGFGVLINPISGIHLFLSSQYAFEAHNVWRWNYKFIAGAYLFGCTWLYLFSRVNH